MSRSELVLALELGRSARNKTPRTTVGLLFGARSSAFDVSSAMPAGLLVENHMAWRSPSFYSQTT
jgi:hypothetical protein